MTNFHRHVIVPYTAGQMYELVNDVASYPSFLPWCSGTHILDQSDARMTAAIEVSAKGMQRSFTTRNFLTTHEKIEMTLVEGPFKHFSSLWQFKERDDGCCEITFDMSFAFTNRIMTMLLGKLFHRAATSMVEAFIQRADVLYGKAAGMQAL
ncbi:MAG: type II toxin-antitoxin system RatA family toxin [Pseudomonadota bacterium]